MAQTSGFTIKDSSELDREFGKWVLVRRSLGIQSFGINMVELAPGDDLPEHDELDRDQEELFYIVSGSPTIVIEGEKHPAQPGTFVRLDPELRRTVVNNGDEPATLMIVSAPRSSGYQAMDWA
ncbi:MAG: cupin domain-containing protein [Solirubrobacterales bacterium]